MQEAQFDGPVVVEWGGTSVPDGEKHLEWFIGRNRCRIAYLVYDEAIAKSFLHLFRSGLGGRIVSVVIRDPAEMIAVQLANGIQQEVQVYGIGQSIRRIVARLNLVVAPVIGGFSSHHRRFPAVAECGNADAAPLGPAHFILVSPRIPVDTKVIVAKISRMTNHNQFVRERNGENVPEDLLDFRGNIGGMLFAPLSNDAHLNICDARVGIPALSQFVDHVYNARLKVRT